MVSTQCHTLTPIQCSYSCTGGLLLHTCLLKDATHGWSLPSCFLVKQAKQQQQDVQGYSSRKSQVNEEALAEFIRAAIRGNLDEVRVGREG